MAKYLVVHPNLYVKRDGKHTVMKAGKELDLEKAEAKALIASGKIKLIVAKSEKKK